MTRYKPLLDLIAKHESGGDYDIVWGGIAHKHRPNAPLTRMTVGQVLDWQDSIDHLYRSEAAGKYQILEDTLRGLYREAGVKLNDKFDEATQDKLAVQLLRRRGLDIYLSGSLSKEAFANRLAMEWASLPVVYDRQGHRRPVKRGQSYYAGDGLNKALTSPESVLQALEAIRYPSAPTPQGWLLKAALWLWERVKWW